jgi:hypothetical protein
MSRKYIRRVSNSTDKQQNYEEQEGSEIKLGDVFWEVIHIVNSDQYCLSYINLIHIMFKEQK